ncbi:MAG: DUF4830 domain-containing protein [Clostridiales bacterium]|nr:DUF4830 domain-containing protein [Clostridiales bacterium]
MFVFTAKFDKRKAIIIILALAVLLCAIILIAGSLSRNSSKSVKSSLGNLRTNEDRVDFLKELGWEVNETPVETQEIVIPREFKGVYEDYAKLQREQGFTLDKYGGMKAVRYTYKILNYPGDPGNVVADMIIYGSTLIAGDIQSTALDGFMIGLVRNPG